MTPLLAESDMMQHIGRQVESVEVSIRRITDAGNLKSIPDVPSGPTQIGEQVAVMPGDVDELFAKVAVSSVVKVNT